MANEPQQAPTPWGSTSPVSPGAPASQVPPSGGVPHVPAPTMDVQIRTMASDLLSLKASGGNTVAAESIAIVTQPGVKTPGKSGRMLKKALGTIVGIVVVAGLAYAGYALYHRLVQTPAPSPTADTGTPVVPDDTVTPPVAGTATEVVTDELPGAHQSFLKKPAETKAVLTLSNDPVTDPSKIRTYNQSLRDVLATVKTVTAEIEIRNGTGKPLTFPAFLSAINAPVIKTSTFNENFEPDFTFLTVREGSEVNAAYILKLRSGKNWLFIKDDIAKLETATGLEALFPRLPGLRDQNFQDSTAGKQPVRFVKYTNPDAQFVYGWFREYLILATSPAALSTSLDKLCFESGTC